MIDYFVIVDTGSSDGTPQRIQQIMEAFGIPGEIHFRDWVNFGHNRQQALELAVAAGRGDWLLFIDADEELACRDLQVSATGAWRQLPVGKHLRYTLRII
ncbi:MAG: glycosyltransferase family 2 protein [Gammaproteobacteria bacterium]